jgi:hypothetical protein
MSGQVHGELQGGSELQRKKSRKKVHRSSFSSSSDALLKFQS